ncbi:TRAP dicarboxylate transporter, DctM subunit, unknown substrate 5 [Marinobacterium lacunae]|uniref:TRAP transporter large permease protein n=1 Tax=Marinobacterium lacunae TaxID=1232683 RepID=A0A081G018_9GAMM|nr:TRAP transporter large permease subunit [Marinobacterium lacunae]KEA64123.1 TRAP dicarboxylate transporter, DctM subunit, unknown substrate 5 [Marinobacterium lacunae]
MEFLELAITLLLVLCILLGSGVWVGLAMIGVGVVAMTFFTGRPVGSSMFSSMWMSSTSWSLTALPLFIWMGEILYRTKLSESMFKGLSPWMNWLPGRLMHTNIVGCTLFAAVSGSSAATLTTVGKMSMPELSRRGYSDFMTIGTLAGASTLGLMIPPSLTMIVYGVITNQSIPKLFIAGIIPGLVLATLFMSYIVLWALIFKPKLAKEKSMSLREKLYESRLLIPVFLLIILVIGSMYAGLATATEAASLGVGGALVLAAIQRSLNWNSFIDSLLNAVKTSCMIALILAGASFLSMSMGFTGLPRSLAEWVATFDLSPFGLLLALMVVYIILGCFLDGISAVVLTMAVVAPMLRDAGIDLLWFGIFVLVMVEMAQITPPVGFNLFVMKGMTHHSLGYIARAALPMFLIMILMAFILIAFPELATYLPSIMSDSPR